MESSSKRLHFLLASSAQDSKGILLDLYEALQLKKFMLLLNARANLVTCMQPLDMIVIVCGPKEMILNIVGRMEIAHSPNFIPLPFDGSIADITPKLRFRCPQIYSDISLEEFVYTYNAPKVMKGLLDHWPALVKWSNPNYFLSMMGHRLVPIELGSSYLESNWTQKIMSMEVFLRDYICTESPDIVAYLAQYDLLSAIPSLQPDVDDLDFCNTDIPDTRDRITRNIWVGMRNCYTPLHFDNYYNMFCQIAGRKHIRLLPPESLEAVNVQGSTLQVVYYSRTFRLTVLD
jgi:lysine-specific demethylase 8